MIQAFRDTETEQIYDGINSKVARRRLPFELWRIAQRKLEFMNQALQVSDLRSPQGNQLQALKGDRAGQYSIRINDQYRICFTWTANGPADVEITDYH